MLEPNHDLLHNSFAVTYMGHGSQVRATESIERSAHKVFKGRSFVRRPGLAGWWHAGWSRIMVHRDGKDSVFDGSFTIDGDSHVIQRGSKYQRLRHAEDPDIELPPGREDDVMVVWRGSDIKGVAAARTELKRDVANTSTCASDDLEFNINYNQELRRSQQLSKVDSRSLFGRQFIDDDGGNGAGVDLLGSIGSTAGCPGTRRVALVGIATDCNYWGRFNGSRQDLNENVIGMVNQASELYESTFNIALGIQNLTVMEEDCPGQAHESTPWNFACNDGTINDRLSTFSQWRGRFEDANAYWTLLTACNTGTAVGLAWRGQLCRQGSGQNGAGQGGGTIAATNVVVHTSTEWQIFAHETGHTFGAVHDCTPSECPFDATAQECCPLSSSTCDAGGRFMMNPSTDPDINQFSSCSIGNICGGMLNNIRADCLTQNRDIDVITGSQCGNGIVETDEQCDCGGTEGCGDNPCCDAETCQFRDNAVCDPANEECCTDQCGFASASTVCRSSSGDCDPEETCAGDSGHCPSDEHLDDGESCGDGDGLRCASGQCTSRDLQCRQIQGGFNGGGDITGACPHDDTCLISCASSSLSSRTCVQYPQNFLDGTPCGAGGHCLDGQCEGTSTWQEIQYWIQNNLNIFIPVVAVVGVLVLAAIGSCIWSCIRRRRVRRPKVVNQTEMRNWPAPTQPPRAHGNGGYGYPPVPDGYQQWGARTRSMRYA